MDTERNDRFRIIRAELGISQGEMAKALTNAKNAIKEAEANKKSTGVTKTLISYLENGKRALTPAISELMRRAFCVNEHWLETGEGSMFIDIQPENEVAAEVSVFLETLLNTLETFKGLEKLTEQYASEKVENIIIEQNRRIKDIIRLELAQKHGVSTIEEVYKSAVSLADTGMLLCDTLLEEKNNTPLLKIDADRLRKQRAEFAKYKAKYSSEHTSIAHSSRIDLHKIRDKVLSENIKPKNL